jgi:MFS family permease
MEKRSNNNNNVDPGTIPGITLATDNNSKTYYQVHFTGPDDPLNPKNWSTRHRIGATMLVCSVAFIATLASAIDAAVLSRTTRQFGISDVAGSLATALFLVGFGLGALLLSPLSELVGRLPVYIGSLVVFGCWILGAALAPDFGAHLVFRFLAGFSASTPLTVAGGTVGDMWNPVEKTFAFPIFAVPAFGGPVFGRFLELCG